MDLQRLARMVAEAQDAKGMSDYALEHEIGRPGGRAFNAKQIDRWKKGLRTQPVPRAVVERLIVILDLDPDETWHAAEMWPAGLDLETYRRLRQRPLEPSLTRAGGSGTPTARSLRTIDAPIDQQGSSIPGSTAPAGQVIQLDDWRPVRTLVGQEAA